MTTSLFNFSIFFIFFINSFQSTVPYTTLPIELLKKIPRYKKKLIKDCFNDYTCRESHVFRLDPAKYPKTDVKEFKDEECEIDGLYITLGDKFVDSEKKDIYRLGFRISSLECLSKLKVNIYEISPKTGKFFDYEKERVYYDDDVDRENSKRKFYVRNFRFMGVVQGVFYDLDKYYAFTNLVKEDLPDLGYFAYSLQVGDVIVKGPFTFKSKIIDYVNNLTPNLEIIGFGDHEAKGEGMKTINFLDNEGGADILFLLGDYAYEIFDDNGEKGRKYFKSMENIMACQPTIMLAGNHEWFDEFAFFYSRVSYPGDPYLGDTYLFTDTKKDYLFNHETIRKNMRIDLRERDSHHFFHFNIKDIFVAIINMDVILSQDLHLPALINRMRNLFEKYDDANHKIFSSHRSLYCSQVNLYVKDCISNIFAMEPINDLLNYFNFNLILVAHLHHYERLVPLDHFRPKYHRLPTSHYNSILSLVSQNKFQDAQMVPSTVVVSGSAGCTHYFTPFHNTDIEYLAFQKQATSGFSSLSLYKSSDNHLALVRFIPSNIQLDTPLILLQENVPRVFKDQSPLDAVIVFGSKGLKSESRDIFYIMLVLGVLVGMAILHFFQEKIMGNNNSEGFRLAENSRGEISKSMQMSIMEEEAQPSTIKATDKNHKKIPNVKTNLIPK
jgi:predicted MPP superfamily phosphohydrolase